MKSPLSRLTSHIVLAAALTLAVTATAGPKIIRPPLFVLADAEPAPSPADGSFSKTPSFEDNFNPGWEQTQKAWQVATWKQNGTLMAKDRCKTNGEGMMIQTVLAGSPFKGGSMQSKQEFGYGRWVARVRASDVPGVLNSIFTKDWDNLKTPENTNDGNKGEVDIELLSKTYGPGKGEVHLAIHLKKHMPLWHADLPLDFNPSEDFYEWGFDILPDRVVWHVNGKKLYEWEYTDEYKIDPDYEFFFNSWTNVKWMAGPPKQDAQYEIDWVKFYPYTPDA